jgi:hypothetical protein
MEEVLRLMLLVLVEFEVKVPHVHICPFVFNVPVVRVIDPVTFIAALQRRVKSDLFIVVALEFAVLPVIVTVAEVPELLSKVTVSETVGTEAPEAPPEVAAQ